MYNQSPECNLAGALVAKQLQDISPSLNDRLQWRIDELRKQLAEAEELKELLARNPDLSRALTLARNF